MIHHHWYSRLTEKAFVEQYLRFHAELPEIIVGASASIPAEQRAGTCRLVHLDGGHSYDVVRRDASTARRLVGPGGIVAFDDILTPHNPGSALAAWELVLSGEFVPLCLTDAKLYGTWDQRGIDWVAGIDEWVAREPDLGSEVHTLAGWPVRRLFTLTPTDGDCRAAREDPRPRGPSGRNESRRTEPQTGAGPLVRGLRRALGFQEACQGAWSCWFGTPLSRWLTRFDRIHCTRFQRTEDVGRLTGPLQRQGGEVIRLLGHHPGGVQDEHADHHGAEEPRHIAGARTLVEVGAVLGDPPLNVVLERREEIEADGPGGGLAAHGLSDHEADEVLDLEHRDEDVGQQLRQAQRLGLGLGAGTGAGAGEVDRRRLGGLKGRKPCSTSTASRRSRSCSGSSGRATPR